MIAISPYPPGKDFAVTFTDDTDLATVDNTTPVYEFLASRGLRGAKSVWVFPARRTSAFRLADERPVAGSAAGATLDDPVYRDFVLGLRDRGFEIALHNVAAGNSTRAEILAGLARFREVFGADPRINIFHERNIENLYAGADKLDSPLLRALERLVHRSDYQGHREGSPYFWGDVAREVFSFVRLPFHTIDEVDTLSVSPSMPFHDPRRPFVRLWFPASDGADVFRFNRLLAPARLARLERRRGACVVYTHFAKGFFRRIGGRPALDPAFVDVVAQLTARPNLWSPTPSELLDRLTAVRRVSVVQRGRAVTVHNGGETDLEGLVLRTDSALQLTRAGGPPLVAERGALVLDFLPAGGSLEFTANVAGDAEIRGARSLDVSRRERRRIERLNYCGLLRGRLRDYRDRWLRPPRTSPAAGVPC